MSLLGDIAAALSEGIGGGMIANAQWGIEEDKQAKKEAADNARLQEQMKRYDADRESRDKYYAAQMDESKAERASRAEQSRLDRDLQWRIANLNKSRSGGGGGGSKSDALSALKMLDTTITGIDGERARLIGKLDGADAATTKEIQATIANLSSQRENLLNSTDASNIWAANGEVGRAHRAQFFANTEDKKTETSSNVPESLVVPPPRSSVQSGETLSSGLLSKMKELDDNPSGSEQSSPAPQTQTNEWETVGQHIAQGRQPEQQPDWNSLKAPQGGWRSPVKTKEVQYQNGQKGYTLEWANQR